jgi:hypothetical protein
VNHPERLAKQVSYMDAHPEVGLLGAQIEFIDTNGKVIDGAWSQDLNDADIRWRMRWQGSVTHSTAMFRRSVVLAAGNYTDTMPYEDHDLWLRMAQIAEVANLPDVLVQYRLSNTSVTGARQRDYDEFSSRAAERNAAILFPPVSPGEAVALRRKVRGELRDQLSWRDVFQFRKAARAMAVGFGKSPDYFTSTSRYRLQRQGLINGVRLGSTYLKVEHTFRAVRSKVSSTVSRGGTTSAQLLQVT